MSEQVKTLKELAERIGWCAYGPGTEEGTPERQANVEDAVLSVMRNYHLIPDTDAIVTEKGLEAGARAIADSLGIAWTLENDVEKNTLRHEARVVLEAAGITIAKEVVTVGHEKGHIEYTAHEEDVAYSYIRLAPGDRVFVKRRKED